MDFLSRLEANFARVRFWEGLHNVVQDEVNVPGLELGSDHLPELDGICLVENESVTVDDGDLFGLWGRADKWIEIAIKRGECHTGYSSLSSPASSER